MLKVMLEEAINQIRLLNRKRVCFRRACKIAKEESARLVVAPELTISLSNIKKSLLICRHTGWGDTLFLNGLIQTLHQEGVSVDLALKKCCLNRYRELTFIGALYDIDLVQSRDILCKEYDCIVDLDYIAKLHSNIGFIHDYKCVKLTCSDVYRRLEIFDYYVDFSKFPHIADRYSHIASCLVGKKLKIRPKISFSPQNIQEANNFLSAIKYVNKEFIYVNAVGRDADRCFSKEQIVAILKCVLEHTKLGIILYSPKVNLKELIDFLPQEDGRLFQAPNIDFFSIASLVMQSRAIISPDTSIVHLASTFNIPVMAVFCKDDIDYFKKYYVSEVWAPLSSGSMIVDFSAGKQLFTKTIPIASIGSDLSVETEQFLCSLHLREG